MMEWSDHADGGGGYFNDNDFNTPSGKSGMKSAVRQQFLCPVTIRQVLEAPDEGLKIGNFTAAMVTLAGVVVGVDISSTKVKFILSDDTAVIECIEWLESDEGEEPKVMTNVVEYKYYQVFGCMKAVLGQRRIMVFKITPIENFNQYTAFLAEVLNVNQYAVKINQMPTESLSNDNVMKFKQNSNPAKKIAFNPIQSAVLEAIKAADVQIGWSKHDPAMNSRFPAKKIEEALDFLVSEGHIYSTVDDDHFSTT